jgi:L-iditol 2-dehydrogenase
LGPEKIEIREVEVPRVEEGEVLLRVAACAICGSDVRIFHHGLPHDHPPQPTGHEIAGEIVRGRNRGRGV